MTDEWLQIKTLVSSPFLWSLLNTRTVVIVIIMIMSPEKMSPLFTALRQIAEVVQRHREIKTTATSKKYMKNKNVTHIFCPLSLSLVFLCFFFLSRGNNKCNIKGAKGTIVSTDGEYVSRVKRVFCVFFALLLCLLPRNIGQREKERPGERKKQ